MRERGAATPSPARRAGDGALVARTAARTVARTVAACAIAAATALAPRIATAVETTLNEAWPELDVYLGLDPHWRLFLMGSITRAAETGQSKETALGVHLDYLPTELPAPLASLWPGVERYWGLWYRVGLQHHDTPGRRGPGEDRVVLEASARSKPLWQALVIANRNRIDLRFAGDEASWRYRNRTRLERTWAVSSLAADPSDPLRRWLPSLTAVTPYASAEFFWDSRYGAWSRRYLQAGVEFALRDDRSLDVYLARQDDRRVAGAHLTILGVAFALRY
ncbi:MAG: hypothetical protein RJA99_1765 [Pseudomonadota bacterium]|jgi:hypothetical protein